jgi:hypothetical protein
VTWAKAAQTETVKPVTLPRSDPEALANITNIRVILWRFFFPIKDIRKMLNNCAVNINYIPPIFLRRPIPNKEYSDIAQRFSFISIPSDRDSGIHAR